MLLKAWLPAVMSLILASAAVAQKPASQVWYTYNQQARISKHWGYLFDLNHRTTAFEGMESVVSAARAGITWLANDHTRLTAGYAWFGQHVKNNGNSLLDENRMWQQAMWNYNRSSFNYFHRVRLEERFRQVYLPGGKLDNMYTTRLRYMVQFQGRLLPPRRPGAFTIKWQAANELMLHAGDYVQQHYFEQNRFIGGIALAPNANIELAVLYQYSLQYQPITERMQQLHTLRLTLLHNLDFRKNKK